MKTKEEIESIYKLIYETISSRTSENPVAYLNKSANEYFKSIRKTLLENDDPESDLAKMEVKLILCAVDKVEETFTITQQERDEIFYDFFVKNPLNLEI